MLTAAPSGPGLSQGPSLVLLWAASRTRRAAQETRSRHRCCRDSVRPAAVVCIIHVQSVTARARHEDYPSSRGQPLN